MLDCDWSSDVCSSDLPAKGHEMSARVTESPTATTDNPMGVDGFEFIEFAHPRPEALATLFETMGFEAVARHRAKNVVLYRQGDVNYVLNAEPDSFAAHFVREHGPCVCAMGFRVADANGAMRRAAALGARIMPATPGPMELHIPAIDGVGGALIYLVDRHGPRGSIWDVDFRWTGERDPTPAGAGLLVIDHLTHNVRRGRMDALADWYVHLFNFREIRYFDIEGRFTGLHSRAMVSPCGKIRIPINESADENSQIEEFLAAYRGEGVQHIACACRDIYETVETLRARGLAFMPAPPATYYDAIDARLPGHGEPVDRLERLGLLVDGATGDGAQRLLLQIFSKTLVGPIFFEFKIGRAHV
jgi:4-hydroxyphenylpyruvate dioxygenase